MEHGVMEEVLGPCLSSDFRLELRHLSVAHKSVISAPILILWYKSA